MRLVSSSLPLKALWSLFLSGALSSAHAFSFSFTAPTQCDNITVSWTGGQSPFTLTVVPAFQPYRNYSIPDSAYDSTTQKGSFTTQLDVAENTRILLAMADKNGLANGGVVSDILSVGSSVHGASCNTTSSPNFTYTLDDSLTQCRTYTFGDYANAIQPVTITGFIPLGQSFQLFPPTGPTSYQWIADVVNGTSILFIMNDSKGQNGGASDVLNVAQSGDSSCLNSNSPSSTASSSTRTGTSGSNSGSSTDGGAIAGGVIGAIVFLLAVALAVWLFLRRRRSRRNQDGFGAPSAIVVNGGGRGSLLSGRRNNRDEIDLLTGHDVASLSSGASLPREYEPRPFIMPSENRGTVGHSSSSSSVGGAPSESGINTRTDPTTSPARQSFSTTTTHQRKAAMAGVSSYTPSRFIVHTDADDTRFQDDDDEELIELPPQYSDRRLPSNITTPSPSDSQTGTSSQSGP